MMRAVESEINSGWVLLCGVICLLLGQVGAARRVRHQEVVLGLAVAVTGLVKGGLVLGTDRGHQTIGAAAGKGIMSMC